MDTRSSRSILVRLGAALCLLGTLAGGLTVAAMAVTGQLFHDNALWLSGAAVAGGLLLVALAVMLSLRVDRGSPELYHGPESSTLSFAPPSVGAFPDRKRLPNLRRKQ